MLRGTTVMRASRPLSLLFATLVALLVSIVGLLLLTIILALVRSEPNRPFPAAFADAACAIHSTLFNPSTIWSEDRIVRRIVIDQTKGIDFTAIPSRWQFVCLTSAASGGIELDPVRENILLTSMERPICWNWSRRAITVLVVEDTGVALPFLLEVPRSVGSRDVGTDYAAFPKSRYVRQCSPRNQAVADCSSLARHAGTCMFGFGQNPGSMP